MFFAVFRKEFALSESHDTSTIWIVYKFGIRTRLHHTGLKVSNF